MFPRIIALSDTHNNHQKIEVPECDILIHAGDATTRGSPEEIMAFLDWFGSQKSKYKVYVPGNHDKDIEKNPEFYKEKAQGRAISLLIDELIDLDGIKV